MGYEKPSNNDRSAMPSPTMVKMKSMKSWPCLVLLLAVAGCNDKSKDNPAGNGSKPGATASGLMDLKIEDVKIGKGVVPTIKKVPFVENGDRVYVTYIGSLGNGTIVDSNDKLGAAPLTFVVGRHEMVDGFDKGVLGMKPGGERKLSVPAKMAYGDVASENIPANSDMFFTVKLYDIVKANERNVWDKWDTTIGKGKAVAKNSKVTFHINSRHANGSEWETTEGSEPITITIGGNQLFLPLIETAMIGMKPGGVRVVRIPPEIGMPKGDKIGPDMVQWYEIHLLKVQ